ncbi:Galactose/methyl galactoside import ATP-binding protein MglA [subsurface metagenome]
MFYNSTAASTSLRLLNYNGENKMQEEKILLKIRGISKGFPGVKALDNINIDIYKGEIHGLVGENGAGKSTLIKIIMGVYKQDEGSVTFFRNNKKIVINNPIEARNFGLTAAYQDLVIATELTIGENFFLGKLPIKKLKVVDWKKVYSESEKILQNFDLDIDPRKKVKELSIADQTMTTITKVILNDVSMVIFDEPTAVLTNKEVKKLFSLVRRLKERGVAILYISHHLEEVLGLCDRVTVLKDGALVDTLPISKVDKDKLISMMVGRKFEDMYGIEHRFSENIALEVIDLTKEPYFRDISFSVRKGEILSFFGLIGSGRKEVMHCIFGADRYDSGEIFINNKKVDIKTPNQALKLGIGLIPEDKKKQGLALPLSVSHNINISSLGDITKMGVINLEKERNRAQSFINKLNIKTPSYKEKVRKLSGGNQQKVVISKLLCRNLDIFMFVGATVGIDVGAKVEIYHLIEDLIKKNKSVILVSSYLPEAIVLSDRIIVMSKGRIVNEISSEKTNEEELLKMASNIK